MNETIETTIAKHYFFKSFSPGLISELASCAHIVVFAKDAIIASEEDPADRFYAILEGRIAIETQIPGQEPRVVQTLHAGEIVGWSWIFPPYLWCFGARAVKDSQLIEFDARCLRGKTESNHELGYQLMKHFAHVMTQRLKATRLGLVDMYGKPHA